MTAGRSTDSTDRSDIAIVGMSGRFPGARNIETFWQNLKDGVESRTVFSDDDLRAQDVPSMMLNYPGWVKSGFTLDDIEMFDARFFGLTPREADVIDPQHRIFLERPGRRSRTPATTASATTDRSPCSAVPPSAAICPTT